MAFRISTAALVPHNRIIAAYDFPGFTQANRHWLANLVPHIGMTKVGHEAAWSRSGPYSPYSQVVDYLVSGGNAYFADIKADDIGTTVLRTVRSLCDNILGAPAILTVRALLPVHTLADVMNASRDNGTLIAGVGLPSDLSDEDVEETYGASVDEKNIDFADKVAEASDKAGVRAGLICDKRMFASLNEHGSGYYDSLVKIAVGCRQTDDPADDQHAPQTPTDAIRAGADYVVFGRPLKQAIDPVAKARAIAEEIALALA